MLVNNFFDTSPNVAQLFGSKPVDLIDLDKSFTLLASRDPDDYDDDPDTVDLDDDDVYTPTGWEREYGESEEDYRERMEDQESLLEYYS